MKKEVYSPRYERTPLRFSFEEGYISAWVYSREEGFEPHIHINRKGRRSVCVKFCEAEYFRHGNETDTLTDEECEWLDNGLRSKGMFLQTFNSIWEYAVMVWNFTNTYEGIKELPYDLKQPDYTKLNK